MLDERGDHGRWAVRFGRDVEERLARLQPVAEFVLKPSKQDTLFDVEFAPALQFIEERDGLPPALRLFAIHENRKLDPNVLWGQFSFGIDVLPENAESLLEFAVRGIPRVVLSEPAAGPIEARRASRFGHGDDSQELGLGRIQKATAEEELGESPGNAVIGRCSQSRVSVGHLRLSGITLHLVEDRRDDFFVGPAENGGGPLQRSIGLLRGTQQELLTDKIDPAIEPLGAEFSGPLKDFHSAGLLFTGLQQAGEPEEMVDVRLVCRGDFFSAGHRLVEAARLNVDVGADACSAESGCVAHRTNDFLRIVESACLPQHPGEHPSDRRVRSPQFNRLPEVTDTGGIVSADPGNLREALLNLEPTRAIVLGLEQKIAGLLDRLAILRRDWRGHLVFAELLFPRDLHFQDHHHRLGNSRRCRRASGQIADLFGVCGQLVDILFVDRDLEERCMSADFRRFPLEDHGGDPFSLWNIALLNADSHDGEKDENSILGGDLRAHFFDRRQPGLACLTPFAGGNPGLCGEHPWIAADCGAEAINGLLRPLDVLVGEEERHELCGHLRIIRRGFECP